MSGTNKYVISCGVNQTNENWQLYILSQRQLLLPSNESGHIWTKSMHRYDYMRVCVYNDLSISMSCEPALYNEGTMSFCFCALWIPFYETNIINIKAKCENIFKEEWDAPVEIENK
jgi:hypothetical protein